MFQISETKLLTLYSKNGCLGTLQTGYATFQQAGPGVNRNSGGAGTGLVVRDCHCFVGGVASCYRNCTTWYANHVEVMFTKKRKQWHRR